jgi:hypothetical protein
MPATAASDQVLMLPIKRVLCKTVELTLLTAKLGRWFQFLKDRSREFLEHLNHSGP